MRYEGRNDWKEKGRKRSRIGEKRKEKAERDVACSPKKSIEETQSHETNRARTVQKPISPYRKPYLLKKP